MVIAIFATIDFESLEFRNKAIPIIRAHRERCMANEPGSLQHDILVTREDETKLYLYEVFENEGALQLHRNSSSYKQAYSEGETMGIKTSTEAIVCTRLD